MHGLCGALVEVEDGEATVAKVPVVVLPRAFVVGAAGAHAVEGQAQHGGICLLPRLLNQRDEAAHAQEPSDLRTA